MEIIATTQSYALQITDTKYPNHGEANSRRQRRQFTGDSPNHDGEPPLAHLSIVRYRIEERWTLIKTCISPNISITATTQSFALQFTGDSPIHAR